MLAFRLIDNGNVVSFPGLHVPPLLLLSIAAAGVLAGLVSALVAARSATRINVLAALRGSLRPVPVSRPARRRRRIWGPLLVVLGAVMTLACGVGVLMLNDRPVQQDRWAYVVGAGVAIGPCLMQLGIAICSPWLLALVTRLTARAGLSARLAARDARRNPVRTVPVLASVMSVVFVASVVITWSASSQAQYVRGYEYSTAVGVATAEVQTETKDGGGTGRHDAALTAHAAKVVSGVFDQDRIRVLGVAQEMPGDTPSTVTIPHRWSAYDCPANDTTSCSYYLDTASASSPAHLDGDRRRLRRAHRAPAVRRRPERARGRSRGVALAGVRPRRCGPHRHVPRPHLGQRAPSPSGADRRPASRSPPCSTCRPRGSRSASS